MLLEQSILCKNACLVKDELLQISSPVLWVFPRTITALLPILKAFSCVFALFTLEIVLPYLIDRVSVPSPIAIDILMDTMARDRAHMYLFSV